ncbi:OST-HTH/LOTUS domain-containing protein [Frankia sp. AgPm24]|uniref:OST-HTH/LOTUS domain-containing protein n=1 Tax=Frankia sp. AgPm24 TaxID=631128 RepID=UPI002551FADB|nr:OST-HTH/LOTUS domain-containing protein [Frankia sp. AgPm24]
MVSRLREAVTTNPGPDGWTHLAAVGSAIRKHPAIVLKTYGYRQLKDMMVTIDLFELRRDGRGRSGAVYARIR